MRYLIILCKEYGGKWLIFGDFVFGKILRIPLFSDKETPPPPHILGLAEQYRIGAEVIFKEVSAVIFKSDLLVVYELPPRRDQHGDRTLNETTDIKAVLLEKWALPVAIAGRLLFMDEERFDDDIVRTEVLGHWVLKFLERNVPDYWKRPFA